MKLQQFDFVLEHRMGFMNVVPDALSRAPESEVAVIIIIIIIILLVHIMLYSFVHVKFT